MRPPPCRRSKTPIAEKAEAPARAAKKVKKATKAKAATKVKAKKGKPAPKMRTTKTPKTKAAKVAKAAKKGTAKKGRAESEEALTCYFRPMTDTVGFIGLGVMGRPMALNLLKRGFPLVVHSRSRGPVDELVAAGATRADSPADVARKATRIITMLPDGPDVERVLTGDDGVFAAFSRAPSSST